MSKDKTLYYLKHHGPSCPWEEVAEDVDTVYNTGVKWWGERDTLEDWEKALEACKRMIARKRYDDKPKLDFRAPRLGGLSGCVSKSSRRVVSALRYTR